MNPRTALVPTLLLAAACASPTAPAQAPRDPAPTTCDPAPALAWREDPDVRAALEAAKGHRAEIERFLAHADALGDAEKAEAAAFLVANMRGKGYVKFVWKDGKGREFDWDALRYRSFAEAQAALDAIEKERGPVTYERGTVVPDLETISSEFLIRHVDRAFENWRAVPAAERPSFRVFLDFILPYRGSEEPVDDWIAPLTERLRGVRASLPAGATRKDLFAAADKDMWSRMKFDEIYYLHPTDQSFSEMERTRMGRCEDLSNMLTYYARTLARPTACDYTPAWGHSDNNHAWTVDLAPDGTGRAPEYAHAAKVYRKTFSIRPGLRDVLPPGREPPNRWVASACVIDVTAQYGHCADVAVPVDPNAPEREKAAYLSVFNGGEWVVIAWTSRFEREWFSSGTGVALAQFESVGRGLLYLPQFHDGTRAVAAGAPFLLLDDAGQGRPGQRELRGEGPAASVVLTATKPEHVSVDTGARTAVSHLKPGTTYVLRTWRNGWQDVAEFVATAEARTVDGLSSDGLHWLVEKDGRRLERPFTIEDGRQRFW